MPNFNSITLLGNLTKDPELRATQGGASLCKCGIAVNKTWTVQGERKEKTMFIDFVIWKESGDRFAKMCKKGDPVLINGELELDTWEDRNQNKRQAHKVTVYRWQALKSTEERSPAEQQQRKDAYDEHGDIPF